MKSAVAERTTCRNCHTRLPKENMLSLGRQWVADFLKPGEKPKKPMAPLDLVLCTACHLLQLRHTVHPDLLYRQFWYRSGVNEQMRRALKDVAEGVEKRITLQPADWVLDIGANDGTMLLMYDVDGLRKVGCEPAKSFMPPDELLWLQDYFSRDGALQVSGGKRYQVVTAVSMFYDLEDPGHFVKQVREVLKSDGLFVVQQNYLMAMIQNGAFDNICHEHLCYYSLSTLKPILEANGFQVIDVEENDANGGSFRVYARPKDSVKESGGWMVQKSVPEMLEREKGLKDRQVYQTFVERVETTSRRLKRFLRRLKTEGKKIYVYGASTRGSTLLQTVFREGETVLYFEGAAERDDRKWGLRTAGTNLLIVPEEEARKRADYFLVLPWHFLPAIVQREAVWLNGGRRIISPLPQPRLLLSDGSTITSRNLNGEPE